MAQNSQVNAIHDLSSLDVAIMLPLNNAHAEETSALDDASFSALLDMVGPLSISNPKAGAVPCQGVLAGRPVNKGEGLKF